MENKTTFAALRCHFQTGRSYVISGVGRNRVYGFRSGIQCDLGDIEKSEWIRMVKEHISRQGEEKLHQQLLQHLKDQNYAKESRAEIEFKALQYHAARIFDNEGWVDFLDFNRKYRPEVAASARLVWIRTACCGKSGEVTESTMERHQSTNTVCCPYCGRWAEYELLTTKEMEERTYECD